MASIIAVIPVHHLDLPINIAACKAGEIGTLDLGWTDDDDAILPPIYKLRRRLQSRKPAEVGKRWRNLHRGLRSRFGLYSAG